MNNGGNSKNKRIIA
jgi:hypothetical protein